MSAEPAGAGPPEGRPLRLLVVAYYFPPSGGAGVQRVLKWTKHLPAHGVRPTVLTVEAGAYPQLDPTLWADVPAGVAVHRTRSLDPFGAYARLTGRTRAEAVRARTDAMAVDTGGGGEAAIERVAEWVRANAFVPDARVGWVPFAVARGLRLIRRAAGRGEPFDALLTSGPPHSTHLTAWALRRLTGTPWVADFRDPWTDIHYYAELPRSAAARRLDEVLERGVLRAADAAVTVSPSWARLLGAKVGRAVEVIPNGFDPEDFGEAPAAVGERFELVHVGSLYASRNPEALWQALAALRAEDGIPNLRVRLVGRVGEEVIAAAGRHGLEEVVAVEPYVPHAEAVRWMQRATALLLTTEPQRHEAGHVTGKLYEYLAAGRPVLALGDPSGDAAALLRETGGGRTFARDDAGGVARWLAEAYQRCERGAALAGASPEAVAPYARPAQAAALAALLRRL